MKDNFSGRNAPTYHDVLPRNYRRAFELMFPVRWNWTRAYNLPSHTELGRYYIDWNAGTGLYGEDWEVAERDPQGVILTPSGRQYHSIRIAQYALHLHALWCEGRREEQRSAFLAHARWLRDNQSYAAYSIGGYQFDFPVPRYGLSAGWISAMAQGEAISALVRAYNETNDESFLLSAQRAALPFQKDVRAGGVTWFGRQGDVIFQEYAANPPSHVLNGFIYALWGLRDLMMVASNEEVAALINEGFSTLRRRVGLFDAGFWSYYDLFRPRVGPPRLATLKYHAFHIAQLRVTAAMARQNEYNKIAERWASYQRSYFSRAMMWLTKPLEIGARRLFQADSVSGGAVAKLL